MNTMSFWLLRGMQKAQSRSNQAGGMGVREPTKAPTNLSSETEEQEAQVVPCTEQGKF